MPHILCGVFFYGIECNMTWVGYDVISDNVGAVNTLANGATYTVTGDALDKLSATVSTGFEADINSRTKVKVEYNGSFRKEYTDHAGMIRFELKF